MAFKIKDGVRVGTVDVFNNGGSLLVNAPTATKWETARTITLGGDLTGNVSLDGSQNVTLTATVAANSVALGTDTTGNYMVNVSAGSGIDVSHTQSEGSTATVSHADTSSVANVDNSGNTFIQDLTFDGFGHVTGVVSATATFTESDTLATVTGRGNTTATAVSFTNTTASTTSGTGAVVVSGGVGVGGNLNVGGNTVITGNLTVNGTTTTVNSTTTTLDDPILTLGGDAVPTADDNKDRGIEFRWHNATAAKLGFFGFDDSTGKFTFIPDATNSSEVFSGTTGELDAKIDWSNILNAPAGASKATSTTLGLVELFDNTVQTEAANSVTTTAARTYGVQLNAADQMVVNVPWVDTNTTYSKATATTLGLVELFDGTVQTEAANTVTTTAARTYGIQLNAADQAVVNVPWVNTTYGVATSTTAGLVELFSDTVQTVAATAVSATANRSYGVQLNSNGQMVVNVPWVDTNTDTNTTYSLDGSGTTNSVNIELVAGGSGSGTDTINVVGNGISTVAWDETNQRITITSTEADTLQTVTTRGSTTSTAVSFTNTTNSTTAATGAVVLSGGLGVAKSITTKQSLRLNNSSDAAISERFATSATVATVSATAVDTWAIATYRAAKYLVQITQGTAYQVSEVLVLHNGTTTTMTEYGVLESGSALGTFTSDISTTNARLLVTMASATSATIKIDRTLITV